MEYKTHNSVTLNWVIQGEDTSDIEHYILHYRETLDGDRRWNRFTTINTELEVTIPNLKPITTFEFAVSAVYKDGTEVLSGMSDTCKTLAVGAPSKITVNNSTKTSITFGWDPPNFIAQGYEVSSYMIKYQPATDNGTQVLYQESNGPICRHQITGLNDSTMYTISVSAVCQNTEKSTFSDEVKISTLPRAAITVINQLYPDHTKNIAGERLNVSVLSHRSYIAPDGNYRAYDFGWEEKVYKHHVVIMVIGAVGAGKSTLINVIINYVLDVKWEDSFRFKMIAVKAKNQEEAPTKCWTHCISSYTITPPTGSNIDFKLTIIETPGFEDTLGFDHDRQTVEQIRHFLMDTTKHHIHHINAICVVLKASEKSVPLHQIQFSNLIFGLSAHNMEGSFLFPVTFVDGQYCPVLTAIQDKGLTSSRNMLKSSHFCFFPEINFIHELLFGKLFWDMSMWSMGRLFDTLNEAKGRNIPPVCETQLTAPGRPVVQSKTYDSMTVSWIKPQGDTTQIKHYVVCHRENIGGTGRWHQYKTKGNKLTATISSLKPNTLYESAVSIYCKDGTFVLSDMSEASTTYPVKFPVRVRNVTYSKTSIDLRWDPPTFIGWRCTIMHYRIRYRPIMSIKFEFEDSRGSACEHTVDGLTNTILYMISVGAVCNQCGECAFSNEVGILTMIRADVAIANRANDVEYKIKKQVPIVSWTKDLVSSILGYVSTRNKCRTYHFGEMESARGLHLVILLVGETGSGNCTLINCMVNYFLDVKSWEDDDRFKILSDDGKNQWAGRDESQTQFISSYTFKGPKDDNIVTIIDIPGFGNTRCIKCYKIIFDILNKLCKKAIHHNLDDIYVIGFVAQASQARFLNTISEICF